MTSLFPPDLYAEAETLLADAFSLGDATGVLALASDHLDQAWTGAIGFWRDVAKSFLGG